MKTGMKILGTVMSVVLLFSCLGIFSVSAVEEKFTDDCNDLTKIFDTMKIEGTDESLWEVIECPYVSGEKFLQRKAVTPDPFGAWLVYHKDGCTMKDFKFYMNNFKFDYRPQINVYVSADGQTWTKIDIQTSDLVEIGGIDYPGGVRDVVSVFELTPAAALPADTAYVKLETLRENYGLGLRKTEITYDAPSAPEPDTSEPETSEPETSEPETSEPETSEPETSEPETSVPETSEPETSTPESSAPESSDIPVPDTGVAGTFGLVIILAAAAFAGIALTRKLSK